MAFRDYDNDGDNDLLDEIIEEDLFCEDDPELEEHFVSLHHEIIVTNIDRLRMSTDGEGIRTLIVAAGCPLRCKYCINPHTWNK